MKENESLKIKSLVDIIVRGMQEKKAENVTVIDLRNLDNVVCDFFVISNAKSNTQVNAIADSVQKETLEILGDKAWHKEGTETAEWILMDYDFKSELLTYYIDTEKLKKGEHSLKIITRDRMGNETIFIKKFIY